MVGLLGQTGCRSTTKQSLKCNTSCMIPRVFIHSFSLPTVAITNAASDWPRTIFTAIQAVYV